MFNTETLHEIMREQGAYRGVQLALYILEHADEHGVYVAPSKTHVRRLLRRGDNLEATSAEVATVVRQLISSGVLEQGSDSRTFILVGGGVGE